MPSLNEYHASFLDWLSRDPITTHLYFFGHRHSDKSPAFHRKIITNIYDLRIPKYLAMTFRSGAKSTILEETVIFLSLANVIKNGIIIGETETRAAERLNAIKYELETNEKLIEWFGPQRFEPWTSTRALLLSGAYLQAYGKGQSLRGAKHLDARPNFAFLDDIENEDSVGTEEAIAKTMRWLTATLFPAMDKIYYIRMAATPLHPNAACVQLSKDSSFLTDIVPVFYYNSKGNLESAWPERNPLEEMLQKQAEYERLGMAREFGQEYLCEAETVQTKAFDVTTLPIRRDLVHTFHPTYITLDPARTAKSSSSLTGYAVGSWINNHLILWEADGLTIRPREIIDLLFDLAAKYNPIQIGIDKTGLEEFIMQPLRNEMAKRNTLLPILPVKNPKNKLDYLRSLQPYITAGEIVLAKPAPILQAQLQNFPSGKIDVLNCVAYMLQMHPGESVFEGFDPHMAVIATPMETLPKMWPVVHCLNATSTETAGASITILRKQIVVLGDAIVEGTPQNATPIVLANLRLNSGYQGKIVLSKRHFQQYDTIGLRSALLQANEHPGMGGDPARGRTEIQERIDTNRLGVSDTATFTLRALTGGYSYDKNAKEPIKNSYAVLMEAVESAIQVLQADLENKDANYQYTASGRRFMSSRP